MEGLDPVVGICKGEQERGLVVGCGRGDAELQMAGKSVVFAEFVEGGPRELCELGTVEVRCGQDQAKFCVDLADTVWEGREVARRGAIQAVDLVAGEVEVLWVAASG